jgi:hypothetical protein
MGFAPLNPPYALAKPVSFDEKARRLRNVIGGAVIVFAVTTTSTTYATLGGN